MMTVLMIALCFVAFALGYLVGGFLLGHPLPPDQRVAKMNEKINRTIEELKENDN